MTTFIDYFSDDAALYAGARPTYPVLLFEELAHCAAERELAWDCGCGNGQAALALSRLFERVYASDPSSEQIRNAIPNNKVQYEIGAAESSSLPESSVDLIVVAQALHWFDLERFYGEARRVLKPRGALAVVGYDWFYLSPEIDAAVAQKILTPIAPFWAENNRILWDGYRSINFPLDEKRLTPSAIHLQWRLRDLLKYVATWSSARAAVRSIGSRFLEDAERTLADVWGDPSTIRHAVMPLHARVGYFK